jgi:uncharacterized protein GlcG (DUF336 family)
MAGALTLEAAARVVGGVGASGGSPEDHDVAAAAF